MRYRHIKPGIYSTMYGAVYTCNHPVYERCTLFQIGDMGLAVIQQRFNESSKTTKWTEIDPWLTDDIYLNTRFKTYFFKHAKKPVHGLYPTVTIRQIMWGLKMKPLQKERWETVFDRSSI